jgi:hypothetical protein
MHHSSRQTLSRYFLCSQPRTRARADCHQLDQHWFHARIMILTPKQSIFFPSADCNTLHIPSPEDTSTLITWYGVAYPSPLQVSSSCNLGPFSFFSSFGRFSSFLCGLSEISLSLVWRFWTESTDLITHWCTGLDRLARSVSQFCCLCCPGRLVCPDMPTNRPDDSLSRSLYNNYTERTRIAARATEGNRLARRNDKLAD